MDTHSIIKQLTKQLSTSPLEEERITELRPIDFVMDYYRSPLLGFDDPRDNKKHILKWSSEEIIIPYIYPIDNKKHRYFPDFLNQTTKGWFLIEVKPQIQTKPP